MKLNKAKSDVKTFNAGTPNTFKIKADGKAFKILSDGLYSDKITAIIRELSCNALDSHIAAGTPNRPFEVHLPNELEPMFKVVDYGIGLDPEEIITVFCTFFESTKDQSNDYVGALGLGSKSPFSYTDAFIVSSNFDGNQSTYSIYIDDSGVPSCALLNSVDTIESNGVTVSIPVSPNDFGEFTKKAGKVLSIFQNPPIIKGVHESEIDLSKGILLFEDSYFTIFENTNNYRTKFMAVQGNIAFEIELSKLDIDYDKFLGVFESHYNYITTYLDFDMGELDFTPGRETLSYDITTQENIVKKLNLFKDCVFKEVQEEIDKIESFWELMNYLQKTDENKNSLIMKDGSHSILTWNDELISEWTNKKVYWNNCRYSTVTRCDFSGEENTRNSSLTVNRDRFSYRSSTTLTRVPKVIVLQDVKTPAKWQISKYLLDETTRYQNQCLVIRPKSWNEDGTLTQDVLDEIESIKNELYGKEIIYASDLIDSYGKKPKNTRSYNSNYAYVYECGYDGGYVSQDRITHVDLSELDEGKQYFYIPVMRSSVDIDYLNKNNEKYNVSSITSLIRQFECSEDIIFVPTRYIKRIEKLGIFPFVDKKTIQDYILKCDFSDCDDTYSVTDTEKTKLLLDDDVANVFVKNLELFSDEIQMFFKAYEVRDHKMSFKDKVRYHYIKLFDDVEWFSNNYPSLLYDISGLDEKVVAKYSSLGIIDYNGDDGFDNDVLTLIKALGLI